LPRKEDLERKTSFNDRLWGNLTGIQTLDFHCQLWSSQTHPNHSRNSW